MRPELPPEDPAAGSVPIAPVPRRRLPGDRYTWAGWLTALAMAVRDFSPFVSVDEELYFLGSRRLVDPDFLARDISWSRLSPTTAVFDHLIAPLWSCFDAYTIAILGRVVMWGLMAWALTRLARIVRLPAWSLPVGVSLWLLWGQTMFICGSPIEGFQVKSFAYPLLFFALGEALRGRNARAGALAGMATVCHVLIGAWGFLALLAALCAVRRPWRHAGGFLLAGAPFVAAIVLAVVAFHSGGVSAADQARMNEIYVLFAEPHCCDPAYFVTTSGDPLLWPRSVVVISMALLVVFAWPERGAARLLGAFLAALVVFFLGGLGARALQLYGPLKTFPLQLAAGLAPLFLFVFAIASVTVRRPPTLLARIATVCVTVATAWLILERDVPARAWNSRIVFGYVATLVQDGPVEDALEPLYAWIRTHTPRNSVFITPHIDEFWPQAERAQVATMRQPPLDHHILEWKERLEAINGFQPFREREFNVVPELAAHESTLTIPHLIAIRERYGATHYLARGPVRPELAAHVLHSELGYTIYDLAPLGSDAGR